MANTYVVLFRPCEGPCRILGLIPGECDQEYAKRYLLSWLATHGLPEPDIEVGAMLTAEPIFTYSGVGTMSILAVQSFEVGGNRNNFDSFRQTVLARKR
jgi:hypothetical protein